MLNRWFAARGVAMLPIAEGAAVPLSFSDARAEHLATRAAAGLYDFSFMAIVEITGPHARAALERLQTRNLALLAPGRIGYTLLLRENGSVCNDATIWCHSPERYWLCTGRRSDSGWVAAMADSGRQSRRPTLAHRSGDYAILALQGPKSFDILCRALDGPLEELRYFAFRPTRIADAPAWVGRLGYSGELGYEFVVPNDAGADVWRRLLDAGADFGLRECGFEAANSLRVESGYILFGTELASPTDPFELGLERLLTGGEFVGADALRPRRWAARRRRLGGIVPVDPARAAVGDLAAAQVTSEVYAPTFSRSLAMGFIAADGVAPGSLLRLGDGRAARSARLPFYDPGRVLPRARLHGDRAAV